MYRTFGFLRNPTIALFLNLLILSYYVEYGFSKTNHRVNPTQLLEFLENNHSRIEAVQIKGIPDLSTESMLKIGSLLRPITKELTANIKNETQKFSTDELELKKVIDEQKGSKIDSKSRIWQKSYFFLSKNLSKKLPGSEKELHSVALPYVTALSIFLSFHYAEFFGVDHEFAYWRGVGSFLTLATFKALSLWKEGNVEAFFHNRFKKKESATFWLNTFGQSYWLTMHLTYNSWLCTQGLESCALLMAGVGLTNIAVNMVLTPISSMIMRMMNVNNLYLKSLSQYVSRDNHAFSNPLFADGADIVLGRMLKEHRYTEFFAFFVVLGASRFFLMDPITSQIDSLDNPWHFPAANQGKIRILSHRFFKLVHRLLYRSHLKQMEREGAYFEICLK